jgi:AcrR family transcriptional regulator
VISVTEKPRSAPSDPAPADAGEYSGAARPERLGDARSRRSRAALRDALLRLIQHRPFDKITVREITGEAAVSYPTFFNQYATKEALFQDIARTEVSDYLQKGFRRDVDSPDWRPGEGICAYVDARRTLWRTLFTAGASEAMRSEFIRQGRALAGSRTSLGHDFPVDLISGVVASGTFEILAWWLDAGADCPIAKVADMLETLVIEPALGVPPGHFTRRKGGAGEA